MTKTLVETIFCQDSDQDQLNSHGTFLLVFVPLSQQKMQYKLVWLIVIVMGNSHASTSMTDSPIIQISFQIHDIPLLEFILAFCFV